MRPLATLASLVTAGALAAGSVAFTAPTPASRAAAAAGQAAAQSPTGADWYETWIDTPDGESLHVDVMRPAGLGDDVQTPVILVVSPYLGVTAPGPSDRFFDFFEGADVWGNGYTVVQVSTRGTGGSSGCLDILGPGEQIDVVTAVQWSAGQPWSTGRVGMYGKSYDGNTGLVGGALRPDGLHAVVAQQVAPDRYRGSYSDRVRLLQSLAYPAVSYGSGGEGSVGTDHQPQYVLNSASRSADCQVLLAEHYLDDESLAFWRSRDFVDLVEGSTVAMFITTGYLDVNTNIGAGVVEYFDALEGPKHLWIGWWDHVRGNDTVGSDLLAMGRPGFFDAVMRFYDRHLKGVAPAIVDPVVAVQGSDGLWDVEDAWPPKDVLTLEAPLLPGTYVDDATNHGSRDASAGAGGAASPFGTDYGHGTWTFSEPVDQELRIAGIPSARVDVVPLVPRTNVVVNVYDVDPSGQAIMITRGAALVDGAGEVDVALFPTDWKIAPGNRIGLLVSGANMEAYIHVPTNTDVEVRGGVVTLPFLPTARPGDEPGDIAPRLEAYLATAPFAVDVASFDQRTAGHARAWVPSRHG